MANKVMSVIVVFDRDLSDEEFDRVSHLLGAVKGVVAVKPVQADFHTQAASMRVKHEMKMKLLDLLTE